MKIKLTYILIAVVAFATVPGATAKDKRNETKQMAGECTVKDGKLLDASGKPMKGCVMMENGKMMLMEGQLVPMKKNMTMPNGTVCMVDGTCVMKGGAKRKLAEGEIVTPFSDIFHKKGLHTPGEGTR